LQKRRIKNYEILPEPVEAKIACLRCDIEFISISKFNRICKECKSDSEYTEEAEEPN